MSIAWAALYEQISCSDERKSIPRICADAATVASLGYVIDYHVAPSRLRPGFKKHLGQRSIFAVYAAFAAGLALTSVVRRSLDRRNRDRRNRDRRNRA